MAYGLTQSLPASLGPTLIHDGRRGHACACMCLLWARGPSIRTFYFSSGVVCKNWRFGAIGMPQDGYVQFVRRFATQHQISPRTCTRQMLYSGACRFVHSTCPCKWLGISLALACTYAHTHVTYLAIRALIRALEIKDIFCACVCFS